MFTSMQSNKRFYLIISNFDASYTLASAIVWWIFYIQPKNAKNCDISATVWPFTKKMTKWCKTCLWSTLLLKISISKIQHGDNSHLDNRKLAVSDYEAELVSLAYRRPAILDFWNREILNNCELQRHVPQSTLSLSRFCGDRSHCYEDIAKFLRNAFF